MEIANDVNDHMPDYVVRRLMTALNTRRQALNGSRLLLLGMSYKKNTGDARESPSRRVAELLMSLGADVRAVDPHIVEAHVDPRIRQVQLTPEELAAADAVVLLTDHDVFDYELVREHARYVLDCRNRMPRGETVDVL